MVMISNLDYRVPSVSLKMSLRMSPKMAPKVAPKMSLKMSLKMISIAESSA